MLNNIFLTKTNSDLKACVVASAISRYVSDGGRGGGVLHQFTSGFCHHRCHGHTSVVKDIMDISDFQAPLGKTLCHSSFLTISGSAILHPLS
jgi:hypothetical protein